MAITYRNTGQLAHPASDEMYLSPYTLSASAADDIFIAHIAIDDNSTFTPPVGWTLIDSTINGAGQRMMTFWFRATGDHSGDTFVFARVGGGQAIGIITAYRGCKTTGSPIDTYSVRANGSSTTIDADSISPSVANCMILFPAASFGGYIYGFSGTNPVFSDTYDQAWGNNSIDLGKGIRTTADATGARTATTTVPGISIGSLIALAPDVPVPPTAPSLLAASCTIPAKTVASFTTDVSTGYAPLTINFTDTSSYNPTSWAWRFGDGTTSTDQNPTHTFSSPGIYDVELTATNAQGTSTKTVKFIVSDSNAPTIDLAAPVAMFSISSALILPGASATVTDQSSGDIAVWAWTFGDGTTSSDQAPAAHTYTVAGQYIITLTVTDARGLQSSTSQVIVVSLDVNPADNVPTATIDPNYETIDAPGTVLFVSHGSTPDVFYLWDFGDGTTSTADASVTPISHEYVNEGTYTVTLTVTNVYGSSTTTMQIVVRGFISMGVSNTKYYVLDKQNDRVIVYGPTRAFVKTFGSRGTTAGKLKDPTQLLVSRAFMEVT